MKQKRILSALLAVLLSLGTLISCAQENPDQSSDDTTTAAVAETDAGTEPVDENTTTGRENAKDNIPADLTFDGEQISIIYRANDYYTQWDVVGTDNSGDLVKDAVWERNLRVEERFGITLNPVTTQSDDMNAYIAEIKSVAMSGSDEFDVITAGGGATVKSGLYPYLLELSDLNYLDIENPWWFTNAIKELSFDGEHYRYLLGDNMLVDYFKSGVVYYNKDIYSAALSGADPDEMYQAVIDGVWTYDKLSELAATAYADLNGDGVQNVGDQFGLMLPKGVNEATPHMVFACDIVTHSRTGENTIDLSAMNNERNIAVIDKLNQVIHNSTGVYIADKNIDSAYTYFSENNSLFWVGRLSNITSATMREMESDYGILPLPKFNEEQKDYITYIHSSATFTCVPKSVSYDRHDLIGAFLEGWSAEAYRTVITPFIETAMKLKYSRDSLSGQIIDIIFDGAVINFTDMFTSNMNSLYTQAFESNVNSGRNYFASYMGKLLGPAQKSLDNYIEETLTADE